MSVTKWKPPVSGPLIYTSTSAQRPWSGRSKVQHGKSFSPSADMRGHVVTNHHLIAFAQHVALPLSGLTSASMVRECSLSAWSLLCFSSSCVLAAFSFSEALRLTISASLWLTSAWQSLSCCFSSEISPVFWHTYVWMEAIRKMEWYLLDVHNATWLFLFIFLLPVIIASSVNSLCCCGFSACLHLVANRICLVDKGK